MRFKRIKVGKEMLRQVLYEEIDALEITEFTITKDDDGYPFIMIKAKESDSLIMYPKHFEFD